MCNQIMSGDQVFEALMKYVAPLPCQVGFARSISNIIAFHAKKCQLIDAGISVDSIPYLSAVVVAGTGTGKTHLLKAASNVLDINVITIDGSSLCREGWKGPSLSQQLLASKRALDDDKKWLSSILFIDEFDKMKLYGTHQDQGNPMDNLLQLFNQTKIAIESEGKIVDYLDTSRFTILLGGAFGENIQEIIQERFSPNNGLGFLNSSSNINLTKAEYMQNVTMEDLKNYGFTPEILGRISTVLTIKPMKKEDYTCLLTAKHGSVLYKYKNYFQIGYGVDFEIHDSGVEYISNKCINSIFGARAVNPIINEVMSESFTMIDRDKEINKIILKAGDDGCYLEYERGKRSYSSFSTIEDEEISSSFCIKGKTTTEIANQLLSIYKNGSNQFEQFDEFKPFLNLSLKYLVLECSSNDFIFDSLEKLAKTVSKNNASEFSTFDIMIEKILKLNDRSISKWVREFRTLWNKQTSQNLIKALTQIHDSIMKKHKCKDVYFELNNVR